MRRGSAVGAVLALVATTLVALGGPSVADQNEGTTVQTRDTQRLVAVGGRHTCALMDDGLVRCWGDNDNGQLGNGSRAVSTTPEPVPTSTGAVALTAGNAHTCALLRTATVECWGLNSNGQIGVSSVHVNSSDRPVAVPGLSDVRAVASGGFHNCALLRTGHVWCWGLDGVGQLGDGSGTPQGETPTPVEVVGLDDATAIAAGEFHSCARRSSGSVSCWGHNGFGQLGNDSQVDTAVPVAVAGLPDGDQQALTVTAGYGHTCAVLDDADPARDQNTLRCWGSNNQGQLGDGTTTDRRVPVVVQRDRDPDPFDSAYDLVDLTGADVTTAGQQHTCARTVGGDAWCWGNAGRGQVGNGTRGEGDRNPSVPDEYKHMWRSAQQVSAGPVDALTAGGFHTCALSGAEMQCWGYNFYGQLGSYVDESRVPVTVTALQGAASVTAGSDAACARVLVVGTPDTHRPVCWGANDSGQLGAGLAPSSNPRSTVPVRVAGLGDASLVVAGNGHACALPTGSASPRCWGSNVDGQLGDGSTADSAVPVTVGPGTTATQLEAGGLAAAGAGRGHTCARMSDGTAACWGSNDRGQVGSGEVSASPTTSPLVVLYDADPAPPDPTVPDDHVDPQPLTGVVAVAVGGEHACALRTDSTVWCWGSNDRGQVGDGTTAPRPLATQVVAVDHPDGGPPDVHLTDVSSITAGGRHTCAVLAGPDAGQVRCWGANDRGQLGDGTTTQRELPTAVPTIPQGDDPRAVAVTGGAAHTCAVLENGSARCWGDNSSGQLGDGSATTLSSSPVTPVGLDNDTAETIRGALAGSGQPDDLVTSLSAGHRNTCASLIDMTVSCWGSNSSGQLGDGVGPTRTRPGPVLHLDEGVNGNRSPHAADETASTAEDTQVSVAVTTNDADPDGDVVSVLQVTDPRHGTATTSGGTVTYVPDADHCGSDLVPYRVFDGRNGVADAVVAVSISCVDDPPVATDDAASTVEEVGVEVAVLDNDRDPDAGDVLSVLSVSQPAHGTTSLSSGGVTYEPEIDYSGTDSFSYVVQDSSGGTDSGLVTVTVTPTNDPPVATEDTGSTDEDVPVTVPVLANDVDVDGDALQVASVTQPSRGSAEPVAGGVLFTPEPDFWGAVSFTYVVQDGQGGSDTGAVTVTVSAVNDAPVVRDDEARTREGVSTTVPVLANDSDVDGDPLSVVSAAQPEHGSTAVAAGGVTYTPTDGYTGPDAFTYVVSDGNGGTGSGRVSVTVGPGNHPPVGGDDLASTAEDTAADIAVLSNDFDPDGDPLAVASVTQPAHGSTAVAGGVVRYTPAPDFWGTDSFTYVVTDGAGGTDTAAVAVTVEAVSDPPRAVDDVVATPEDVALTVPVLSNDVDPDGDVLSVSAVTQPTHGAVALVSGEVRYTPARDHHGEDAFSYTVTDGRGGSDTAAVSVTVSSVNDPPVLAPLSDRSLPWGSHLDVLASGDDVEGDPLTYSLVSGPPGTSVDWWGSITWTPDETQVGSHTITVRVSDGEASDQRSFTVVVTRQPTVVSYTGARSGQYSDAAPLAARLVTWTGAPVPGATVRFSLAGRSASSATGADGVAATSVVLTTSPGTEAVAASYAGTAAYEPASVSTSFTVLPEEAAVSITGPGLVTTSGSTASAQLSARVDEADDSSAGTALSRAQVRFTDVAGAVLCTAGVTSSAAGSGTAACSTASLPAGSRAVVAELVSASYVAGVDVAAFSLSAVPAGAAAAGGSVADDAGQRSDVAFRAVPLRKELSGDAVQVFRQSADLGAGQRAYAFVVRAESLSSYTRTCTSKPPKVCSVTLQAAGATTLAVDLGTGEVRTVAGTASLRVDATDRAEPSGAGPPPDQVAAAVVGPRPFSVGSPTDQRMLLSGDVRIPA